MAATMSTADTPTLDSRSSGFEVDDMIQVDRPDSAPWYGVIQWMGTLLAYLLELRYGML